MTITLFLNKSSLIQDLSTLHHIFDAGIPELIVPMSKYMNPITISLENKQDMVAVNVTPQEFALIGIFIGGAI